MYVLQGVLMCVCHMYVHTVPETNYSNQSEKGCAYVMIGRELIIVTAKGSTEIHDLLVHGEV